MHFSVFNFKSYEGMVVSFFKPVDKILKCAVAIQMKATEHFSDDVRFIMLYKMVLTFDSVDVLQNVN